MRICPLMQIAIGMNRPKGTEFLGLSVIVLSAYTLLHYIVAAAFMLGFAYPCLYISEYMLSVLPPAGMSRYLAIILSVTAGIVVYVAGVGLLGYAFVKFPSKSRKSKT